MFKGDKKGRKVKKLPKAIRLKKQGMSIRKIAKKIKVPLSTIRRWLARCAK